MTEKEVCEKVGIKDFKDLSPDNVLVFGSLIKSMDPNVAQKAIGSIDNFVGLCRETLTSYGETLAKALASNDESVKAVFDLFQQIQISLSKCLDEGGVTFEEKKLYIETMVKISDKAAELDERNKRFIAKETEKKSSILIASLVGAAGLAVAIIGGCCATSFKAYKTK